MKNVLDHGLKNDLRKFVYDFILENSTLESLPGLKQQQMAGMSAGAALLEKSLVASPMTKQELPWNPCLGAYPKELKTCPHKAFSQNKKPHHNIKK